MTPARWLTVLFFLAYAAAVTWPGAVPFNRIRPLVLGMPLSMVWVALWLVLAFVVLLILDRSETRAEDRRGDGAGTRGDPPAGPRDRSRGG